MEKCAGQGTQGCRDCPLWSPGGGGHSTSKHQPKCRVGVDSTHTSPSETGMATTSQAESWPSGLLFGTPPRATTEPGAGRGWCGELSELSHLHCSPHPRDFCGTGKGTPVALSQGVSHPDRVSLGQEFPACPSEGDWARMSGPSTPEFLEQDSRLSQG